MYCKHCGAVLLEDSLFCSNCGKAVGAVENEVEEEPDTNAKPSAEAQPERYSADGTNDSRGKRRFPILAVSAAALIIMVISALVTVFLVKSVETNNTSIVSARMQEDGTAYIPLMNGKAIIINDDVADATMTEDRKHFVVLLEDGGLYYGDTKNSEKYRVAENCEQFYGLRNDGFFYQDEDGFDYRVLFGDPSPLKLGEDVAIAVARNNTSVLFAKEDSNGIYTLAHDESEANKVGTYEDELALEAISNDASIAVWVTEKNDVQTIVLSENGNRVTLGEVDYEYNYTQVVFNREQSAAVITNSYSDRMWIKPVGEEPIVVKLSDELYETTVYTEHGRFTDYKKDKLPTLYIATEGEYGANVYAISDSGDRERILSRVADYSIEDGNIFYIDEDQNLYQASLDGHTITKETKIASDVDFFNVAGEGKYVYYWKDCSEDEETGTLYCFKIGKKEAVRIASDVSYGTALWLGSPNLSFSPNGKSVFFFKDVEEIQDTYALQGTLLKWTYGDDTAVRIASEAICYSLNSGLPGNEVKPNGFMYLKYQSIDKDENIFANWMYCKGSESEKVATDVIR